MPGPLVFWLAAVNICAYILYGTDKILAQKNAFRISETLLLTVAVLGGALGSLAAMLCFNHKTRKKKFVITVPFLLFAEIILIAVIIY